MSSSTALLTIFTTPKPFTNPHIRLIQRNAILSWQQLGEEVDVLIIGDEPGAAEFCAEAGVSHFPAVPRNPLGTPLVDSVFGIARLMSSSPLLAYVNADIMLTPQFLETARQVYSQASNFLIAGQRHDLMLRHAVDFSAGWDLFLLSDVQVHGHLHPAGGSDYFIFPRPCFTNLPKFTIGRGGWDQWMIYHARAHGILVIDATPSIIAIHQNHDYSHLPYGQPHYRLPESSENIRLAGGPRAMFTLADAHYLIHNGLLERIPLRSRRLRREIEIFPLVNLHSQRLVDTMWTLLHPAKAWREWRTRAERRSSGRLFQYA
jgi:hypothetical protein